MTEATTASTKPPTTTSERVTTEFDARRKYQPLIELGRGGMAIVHAALARGISGFSKLVVSETIRSDAFSDNDRGAVKAFVNEARLSARMNHPNVVQVYEVCREAKLPVIVMEYLRRSITREHPHARLRGSGVQCGDGGHDHLPRAGRSALRPSADGL